MSTTTTTPSTHLDRKDLKRPDEFTTSVQSGFTSLSKHTTALLIGVGVLAAVGAGLAFWSTQRQSQTTEGMNALFEARSALDQAYVDLAKAQQSATPPAKGEKKTAETPMISAETARLQPMDVDAKLGAQTKQLAEVADKFAGTRAGFEARYTLGETYFRHGEAAKALTHFEKASATAPNAFEKSMAFNALGYAYETSGKHAEAVAAFEKASQAASTELRGPMLLAIARNHELAGAADQARAAYDQVIKQLPNSEAARTAELLKAQVK